MSSASNVVNLSARDQDRQSRKKALAALGDMTRDPLGELVSLYDALTHAAYVWTGAINMPGEGRVSDICDNEHDRIFLMQREIARELHVRKPADSTEADARVRVLADWKDATGGDDNWS